MPARERSSGAQLEDVLALEDHRTRGDLVSGVPRDHFGERALPRSVRAHDRVDFAFTDLEIQPLQDLQVLAGYLGVEVGDTQNGDFAHDALRAPATGAIDFMKPRIILKCNLSNTSMGVNTKSPSVER